MARWQADVNGRCVRCRRAGRAAAAARDTRGMNSNTLHATSGGISDADSDQKDFCAVHVGPCGRRRIVRVRFPLYRHSVPGGHVADTGGHREGDAYRPHGRADAHRLAGVSARLPASQQAAIGPGGRDRLCYACFGGVYPQSVRERGAGNGADGRWGSTPHHRAPEQHLLLSTLSHLL